MSSYCGATCWGGWRRRGVVGVLCGAHALALVAHVPSLCLLRLREILVHVGDGDERPGKIVPILDAFEPSGFCRETCSGVEIPDCALYAGSL